jgi:RNA polymerase sigma factor (sigma-70 family)
MEYAVRLAPEYRPELGASFQSFIYLRVRRAMLQALRRERRDLVFAGDLVPAVVDSPEELMALAEERARHRDKIEATLATLEEVDCRLVRACHWEDLSLAEAARSVGLEYERARYRFNVAMSTMRRKLRAA